MVKTLGFWLLLILNQLRSLTILSSSWPASIFTHTIVSILLFFSHSSMVKLLVPLEPKKKLALLTQKKPFITTLII